MAGGKANLNKEQELLLREAALEAKQDAMNEARSRVDFYFIVIGLLVTLLAGAIALFIDVRIADRVEDTIAQEVREELNTSVLIPLLVGETISIVHTRGGYNPSDADNLLDALDAIKDDIMALPEDVQELAFNRVEDTTDVFLEARDYERVFEVHDIFGDALLEDAGIYVSVALAAASRIVIHPDFSQRRPAIGNGLRAITWDPSSNLFEYQRLFQLLDDNSHEGFTVETLSAAIAQELRREPAFSNRLERFIGPMTSEVAPGGRHHSELSVERLQILTDAFVASTQAGDDAPSTSKAPRHPNHPIKHAHNKPQLRLATTFSR